MALPARLLLVVLSGVALGCGATEEAHPPPTNLPAFESGSRLVMVAWDGGDGARVLRGIVDTKLDVACGFAMATDGTERCMPETIGAAGVFSDPECTQPAIDAAPEPCAPASPVTYSIRFDATGEAVPGACETPAVATALRGGAPIAGATREWTLVGKECFSSGVLGTLLAATVVDPAELVQAQTAVEAHGDGFSATVLVGDDGSRWTTAPRLTARDEECWPLGEYLAIDDYRCVPRAVAWRNGGFFSGPSCTTQVAYTPAGCSPEVILQDDDIHGCSPTSTIYEVAGRAPEAYELEKTCTKLPAHDGHSYWTIGPQAPPSTFPALGVVEVGAGRLRARFLGATSDHAPMVPAPVLFHDTMLNEDCTPVALGASMRCVPSSIQAANTGYFSDSACTTSPVAEMFLDASYGCGPPLPKAMLTSSTDAQCHAQAAVTALGAEVTGEIFEQVGVACLEYARQQGAHYLLVGATVPASTFAPIAEVTDSPASAR